MSRQDAAEKHSQMPMSLQQISGKKSMSQQQIPESKNTINKKSLKIPKG
jgi:hypothetical protein